MTTLVYRFGLRPPHENATLVHSQMRAAHDYRNHLVAAERGRRAAVRAVLGAPVDIATLESAARQADTALLASLRSLKASRAATRSRSETEQQRAAVKTAREQRKQALKDLREARKKLRGEGPVQQEIDQINERGNEFRRNMRAHCGVYWGTYLSVEAADEQARKDTPLYDGIEPSDPRFKRWRGDGSVGVQIQGGLSIKELLGAADTQVRIEEGALPPGADPNSKRSARRKYAVLAMRVDSDEKRKPIWARWRMVMHRPFPENARIKWVKVHLKRFGWDEWWVADFTIETAEVPQVKRPGGAVAVDLGWRRGMEPGLRVATWLGEDGRTGKLVLSEHTLEGLRKADDLRSIRDKNFDAARARLVSDLAALAVPLPPWLTKSTRTISHWRSAARLAALARTWRMNRFVGDDAAYDSLEAWRYDDHHLWHWEVHQRESSLRNRKEIYRLFAKDLSERYDTVVLEDFKLDRIALKPTTESEKHDNKVARHSRQTGAVSELRICLIQGFAARGGRKEEVPAQDTTKACHACGSVEDWNQAEEVHHVCSKCGVLWDQDDNAAVNLLRRRNQAKQEEAKPAESRWAKAKAKKSQKVAATTEAAPPAE